MIEDEDQGDGADAGEDDDDDDEPINPLVDALFDEIESLRMQLFESEMRCAIIEAETREEVIEEMEERMRQMENMYTRRLLKQVRFLSLPSRGFFLVVAVACEVVLMGGCGVRRSRAR